MTPLPHQQLRVTRGKTARKRINKAKKIVAYLTNQRDTGNHYHKSKGIANQLDLTSNEVGQRMGWLSKMPEEDIGIIISPIARSCGSTTWEVR